MLATVSDPACFYDEAIGRDGSPRAPYCELLEALADKDLGRLAARVSADVADRGVAFGRRPFRVDPVPRIFEPEEWGRLERGLTQRARALNAFLADVYCERAIVDAGVVPARVIDSAEHFEPWMLGVSLPHSHAPVVGFDVVRGADGELCVLEDNARTPSGFAYAAAARAAVDARLPGAPPYRRRAIDPLFGELAEVIRSAGPSGVDEPFAVLLSDGASNSAWYEHRTLARAIGLPLVTPGDLYVSRGRLWAMVTGPDARAVDVVYRRTDEDCLRDRRMRPTWIGQVLLEPIRRGTLGIVNAPGAGVADDKLVHAYVGEMIRFYLGEEPLVPSVPTYDLAEEETRRDVIARIEELVVKPRAGHGGHGVVICPHASSADVLAAAALVSEQHGEVVAQETVSLSIHPTVCDGMLEPRHVDLRAFVVGDRLLPLALTRVAFDAGALVVNSSQNGGGKATWVMA